MAPGPFTFLAAPAVRVPAFQYQRTSRKEASTGQDQSAENAKGLGSWPRTHAMHHATIVATAALAAVAPAHHPTKLERAGQHLRTQVIRLYGHRAPGCDLIAGKCRHHPHPSWQQKHRYVQVLRRMIAPPPAARLLRAGHPYLQPAQSRTVRAPAGGTLAAIRACESGGNYGTNTGNGFAGAYQFTQSTWESVGGSGSPAAASPAEQDRRAAMLYAREGSSPWPVCGR